MRFQRNTRLGQPKTAAVSGSLDQRSLDTGVSSVLPGCSAPTSLPPFAPRPLRRLNATMEALTPGRVSPPDRSPCFTHPAVAAIPPSTTRRTNPRQLCLLPCSAPSVPHRGNRLRRALAGSPIRPAETGSLSCGLAARLRLLSTPPRGDAVTFGYRPEHKPGGDFHPSDGVRLQAHNCGPLGRRAGTAPLRET